MGRFSPGSGGTYCVVPLKLERRGGNLVRYYLEGAGFAFALIVLAKLIMHVL